MAQVNGKQDATGHRVRRVRCHFKTAYCKPDCIRRVIRQLLQSRHHADRGHKGVLADVPWCGARVCLFPRHLDAKPPYALDARDNAKGMVRRLQEWPLFNMGWHKAPCGQTFETSAFASGTSSLGS
jgi:hypothetical protein